MRLRDLGVTVGTLPAGKHNAITDVAGVRVGHTTVIEGDDIRTGATAIVPHGGNLFQEKTPAAAHTINGYGKACGFEQVRELGCIETPLLLTNTLNVGRAADALIDYTLGHNPDAGSINPVVGECNDGYLNDIAGRHVNRDHVLQAIESATDGTVDEGCIGAGTGTICYGYKGGIGTASRVAGDFTLGALLQTNFGRRDELMIAGVPLGRHLADDDALPARKEDGSVMIVIATDAPLTARQLSRLSHRAAFGLGRTGTVCHHGSGDFVLAFSTAYTLPQEAPTRLADEQLNPLFQAVVECVEEAVYNSLIAATDMDGRAGRHVAALPHEALRAWLAHYRRL